MATYTPESIGIKPPAGGFQTGGWYGGRQYWGGTLSDVNAIHPASTQQGAGQQVSQEVVAQSAQQQGVSLPQMNTYLQGQQQQQNQLKPTPVPVTQARPVTTQTGATQTPAMTTPTAPTLDLPNLYKGLQESSGVKQLEDQYLQQEKDFITAKGELNNNPYLSEATRVGREEKLTKLFNERTANLQKDIAMKKADIETQLNLQTKQFDINSQEAKTNFEKFNTLLTMGALNNASGEDIANITRSTGISSDMIKSAIDAVKKSKEKAPNTQVIKSEADDGTVTVSVINTDTGDVISQKSLGRIGNVQQNVDNTKETKEEQMASVEISARSYMNDKNLQAQMSPELLYETLLQQFPQASQFIIENYQPYQIRSITKQ